MSDLLQFILSSSSQFRRARLPSLYSDFTLQRASNPDGFAANISAWENALRQAAKAGLIPAPGDSHDTLSLRTGEELLQALTTKEWGRPLALGAVIDEAVEKRHLIPLQEFLDPPSSIYSRKWAIRPWWLISWGLKQLSLFERQAALGRLPTARYVVLSNVEEAAGQIVSRMADRTNLVDRIYSRQMFTKEASKAVGLQSDLTDSDLSVMLRFLARDKGLLVYDDATVKFKGPNEPLTPLTSQDKTVASLKTLIADLNVQVTALNIRITSLSEKAQSAVKAKNRVGALAALKSKKVAETTLSQRYETLDQVVGVYGKIEQAADQVAVIRIMEASTGVLRSLHSQVGGVEKVEVVVENLRDEMGKVDEIGQVMEEAGQGNTAIDEDAVDEELEALERQERVEKEKQEAEQTRRRLAELDAVRRPEASDAPSMKQPEDPAVATDSEVLQRLPLERPPSEEGTETAKRASEALTAGS